MAPLESSKETVLKQNLRVLRESIDQFFSDKGRFPDTLDELVEARYLRSIPVDPITESASTWVAVPARDPDQKGIADVKSGASGTAKEGGSYASY